MFFCKVSSLTTFKQNLQETEFLGILRVFFYFELNQNGFFFFYSSDLEKMSTLTTFCSTNNSFLFYLKSTCLPEAIRSIVLLFQQKPLAIHAETRNKPIQHYL